MSRILRSIDIGAALRHKQRGFLLNPFRFGGGGGGPTRNQLASDDFDRASLGTTDWSQVNGIDGSMAIFSSDDVFGPNALGDTGRQAAKWIGAGSIPDDQYVSLVIAAIGNFTADYSIGVIARASTGTDNARDFYEFVVLANSAGPTYTTKLGKITNDVYDVIHSASVAWSVGDRIELEVYGQSPNITLRGCKNGTPLGGSFTVTNESSFNTGLPGICGSGGSSVARGDAWRAGSLT